jgi:hypothetical protein
MKRNEIIILGKKLRFYRDENTLIHIRCNNGRFYNGYILDLNLDKSLLVLKEVKIGEVPILFEEILVLEPFKNE